MGKMEGETTMTIQLDFATVVYIASCIGILGAAVKVLYSAKKALVKPLDDINDKLKAHDTFLANDKTKLEKIDYILEDMTKSMNMLIKSHRIVLHHLEDGNHNGEIRKEIEELDNWLIDSRGYLDGR